MPWSESVLQALRPASFVGSLTTTLSAILASSSLLDEGLGVRAQRLGADRPRNQIADGRDRLFTRQARSFDQGRVGRDAVEQAEISGWRISPASAVSIKNFMTAPRIRWCSNQREGDEPTSTLRG